MSATKWSRPYTYAEDAARAQLAWNPLAGDRAPKGAVRFVVRWRVTGFANSRKRTFAEAAPAEAWVKRIAAAKMLGAPRDERGWPMLAPGEHPSAALELSGQGPSAPEPSAPELSALGSSGPGGPLAAPLPAQPKPAGGASRSGGTGEVQAEAGAGALATVPDGARSADLGPRIEEYLDELIRIYQPSWEERERQHRWWIDQLAFVRFAFSYQEGDERLERYGLEAGGSIHFSLLTERDFNAALHLRRTTNLRVLHQNRQRAERHERLTADYEEKLVAWHARSGRKGRRPTPPAPVRSEDASSENKVLIGANTEHHFRTTCSFVFDRAYDAGYFPPGPNRYRQWNPRGSGGGYGVRRGPFRTVERRPPHLRDYPGLGFFVDLGDAMARRGALVADGTRTGERYRILPLTVVQLATRPGECHLLHHEHCHGGTDKALIEPEPGGHLKRRAPGESRAVPLTALVGALVDEHLASGLAGPDGTLFLSPYGAELDLTNLYEDFLRPAIAELCGPQGPWPAFPALEHASLYDLRKAGITTWVAAGADTLEASRWAGHTETELLESYRGVINGRGRRVVWAGMDAAIEQALLDDPPRGDGLLAVHIRTWLGL